MEGPSTELIFGLVASLLASSSIGLVNVAFGMCPDGVLQSYVNDKQKGLQRTAKRLLAERYVIRLRLTVSRAFFICTSALLWTQLCPKGYFVGRFVVAAFLVAILDGLVSVVFNRLFRKAIQDRIVSVFRWTRPFDLLLMVLTYPVWLCWRLLEKMFPVSTEEQLGRVTEFDVETLIERGQRTGTLSQDHAEMLKSILEFQDTLAREVMVPRTQMVALDIETSVQDALKTVLEKGHSRYPVYRERIDQIEGLLYAKDIFKMYQDGTVGQQVVSSLVRRPAYFVPESKKITSLLREMQARRIHLAIVVDEFGGTNGIVTLEDIIEEIVGEIQDEHDNEDVPIRRIKPDLFLANAAVSIYDLEDFLGEEMPRSEGDYDSVGGMVTEFAGAVPQVGESVEIGPFIFTVREADKKHVTRVEIRRVMVTAEAK
ncbi:MAG: HlyC/CorC family transporter [Myxococcales bacterium]|nr:MAG: HlyC/CorC family transporter [Myxococcales bacterium]